MPLERYEAGQPVIDEETLDHVRFGMLDSRVIPCRIPIELLHALTDTDDLTFDPLAVFLNYRTEIEDVAINKYEREGAPNGILELDDTDFV
jgi:hypothetical protein